MSRTRPSARKTGSIPPPRGDAGPLHRQSLGVAGRPVGGPLSTTVEAECSTATSPSSSPRRSFGPGQVAEDADLAAGLRGGSADPAHVLGVLVRASPWEKLSRKTSTPASTSSRSTFGLPARRADGGDDLGAARALAHRASTSGAAASSAIDSNTSRAPASRSSASPIAPGEHRHRRDPGPFGRLAVPDRVADHQPVRGCRPSRGPPRPGRAWAWSPRPRRRWSSRRRSRARRAARGSGRPPRPWRRRRARPSAALACSSPISSREPSNGSTSSIISM